MPRPIVQVLGPDELQAIRSYQLEGRERVVWFADHPYQIHQRGDGAQLLAPYGHAWIDDGVAYRWILPVGFVHDGGSVPDLARPIVPKRTLDRVAPHHDRGYRMLGVLPENECQRWCPLREEWVDHPVPWSRKALDSFMGVMMREDPDGPGRFQRRWVWRAIRVGGWWAWRKQERKGREGVGS